jgi:hypothetical protein
VAIAFKTSGLLSFHRALVRRKYRLFFSPNQRTKPSPKGPMADLIHAVVEMKKRNPTWDASRLPVRSTWLSEPLINKDVVRRILALHYCPDPGAGRSVMAGFLGHTKDSLWSLDLFRCESMLFVVPWGLEGTRRCLRCFVLSTGSAVADQSKVILRQRNVLRREARNPKHAMPAW